MVIYKITNLINGKIYIGQTTRNIKERFKSHCNRVDNKSVITHAIKKYGKENFKIEEICSILDIKYLDELEVYFIKELNSLTPNGYNLETGGHINKRASIQLKEKLSKAKLGKIYGPRKKGSGDNISKGKGSFSFKVFKKDENEFIGTWTNREQCARDLNLNSSHIKFCLKGYRNSHKGYIFVGER